MACVRPNAIRFRRGRNDNDDCAGLSSPLSHAFTGVRQNGHTCLVMSLNFSGGLSPHLKCKTYMDGSGCSPSEDHSTSYPFTVCDSLPLRTVKVSLIIMSYQDYIQSMSSRIRSAQRDVYAQFAQNNARSLARSLIRKIGILRKHQT